MTCTPDLFDQLSEAFTGAELSAEISEVSRLPQTTVDVDSSTAKKVIRLLENLEENDDVQNVSTNLNITAELLEEEA